MCYRRKLCKALRIQASYSLFVMPRKKSDKKNGWRKWYIQRMSRPKSACFWKWKHSFIEQNSWWNLKYIWTAINAWLFVACFYLIMLLWRNWNSFSLTWCITCHMRETLRKNRYSFGKHVFKFIFWKSFGRLIVNLWSLLINLWRT